MMQKKGVLLLLALTASVFFTQMAAADVWWNASWYYRIPFNVTATTYQRVDWPIEYDINFTATLATLNVPGAVFDNKSIRVIEYNSSGGVIREIQHQFDHADEYNATSNAFGTLVFLLNGTTAGNTTRNYHIYFDSTTRAKTNTSYATNLTASWNGEEVNVNNTIGGSGLRWYIDTLRGENTSGLYRVTDLADNEILTVPGAPNKTIEYIQYANGSQNFTFNFTGATFKHRGPIRIVIEQLGNETYANDTVKVTEGMMRKRYIFYAENQWIKIEQNYTNARGPGTIQRNSTPAGALALDAVRAGLAFAFSGNATEPGSWQWIASTFASAHIGIVNINNTKNITLFNATERNNTFGRIGIELNLTSIVANTSIFEVAALHFNSPSNINGGPSETQISDLSNRLVVPANITENPAAPWEVILTGRTNYSLYNRNETINVYANISLDATSLVSKVNASLNSSVENVSLILYDDGTHGDATAGDKNYTHQYNLTSINATLGRWNMTVYAYSSEGLVLNSSTSFFNVTQKYSVNMTVFNVTGLISRTVFANLSVQNFRNDTNIVFASISCSGGNSTLFNITELGSGRYFANFTSATSFGTSTVNCSASFSNNTGSDTEQITTEDVKTVLSGNFSLVNASFTATQITLYQNETFAALLNISNVGEGTAYSSNFTIAVYPGWISNVTLKIIGTIINATQNATFLNITIPNGTGPGNYTLNATVNWTNPDGTVNSSRAFFNITVNATVLMNITESNLTNLVPRGQTVRAGNLTISSLGNANLTTVTFSMIGLSNMTIGFNPSNIANLTSGSNQSIEVNVTVPSNHAEGTFSGLINISSANNGSKTVNLTIEVPGTNMSISFNQTSINALNVSWYDFTNNFTITLNATNTGSSTAVDANISISLPGAWASNETNNISICNNILSGQSCLKSFEIRVRKSNPGNYTFNASINWTNIGVGVATNLTTFTVQVLSNPRVSVEETNLTGNGTVSDNSYVGNFTLRGIGNDDVSGLAFAFTNFSNFSFNVTPSISVISEGENQSMALNVTVPSGHPAGTFTGTMNASSSNGKSDILILNITIPSEARWNVTPLTCTKATIADIDKVCDVLVNNSGNAGVNFTIYIINTSHANSTNHTFPNMTSFFVSANSTLNVNISYNLTNITRNYYNFTYNISAIQASASPRNISVSIFLQPQSPPVVNISFNQTNISSPNYNITEQGGSVTIYVNVSDYSGGGIDFATINVTIPNGTTYTLNMTASGSSGSTYNFFTIYPSTWGNASFVGLYNITVRARDGATQKSEKNTTMYFYPKVNVSLTTGFPFYYTGETGSILFNVTDAIANPMIANATIRLFDSANNIRFNTNYQTTVNGTLPSLPIFEITDDAPLGNYTFRYNASTLDSVSGILANASRAYNLTVIERYDAALETAVVWYPNSVMTFYVTLATENNITAPDQLNLTLYDPAQSVYTTASLSNFQVVNQTPNTLLYVFEYAMPISTAQGFYLADLSIWRGTKVLKLLKSFRVSAGGPYDIVISNYTSEVPQGSTQDFILFIDNIGDFGQDVTLDYWISRAGTTYVAVSGEAVFTPGASSINISRSLPVFSSQALGTYSLNVNMTYSSIEPMKVVNKTFLVTGAVSGGSGGGGGGGSGSGGPGGVIKTPLQILNVFPEELLIERGGVAYIIMEVKNNGEGTVNNIEGMLSGIPSSWFNLIREIEVLNEKGTGYLIMRIAVPNDAQPQEYFGKLKVSSAGVEISKEYRVQVFESKEELLRTRIKKAKEAIQQIESEAVQVAQEGGDITEILSLLGRANRLLSLAVSYLEEGQLVETTESLDETLNVLEEARYKLSLAKPAKQTFVEVIPLWVKILVAATIVFIILGVLFFNRYLLVLRNAVSRRIMVGGKKSDEKKEKEKENKEGLSRHEEESELLKTLRKHHEEGLISDETFEELSKKYKS